MHGCKEDVIAVMSCCLAPMICWQIFVGVGFLDGFFFGWLWGRMEIKDASFGPRFQSFCFAVAFRGSFSRAQVVKDDNTFRNLTEFFLVAKVLGKNTIGDFTPLFDGREHANIYIHHMLRYDGVDYIRSQWDMKNCFPLGPVRLTLG